MKAQGNRTSVDRLVIAFIVLLTMLFVGIGIMTGPRKITTVLSSQSNTANLGALMTFASILFVTGLVGIGVMGFILSKGQTAKKMDT
ncbi:MAG: hypothetical protein ACJ718_01625 [Nitrososphaeraceae archaeon]